MKRSLYSDKRYLTTGQLLTELGFLVGEASRKTAAKKIPLRDALWAGEHVEPRFLAVLPAALLAYPERFSNQSEISEPLRQILRCLENGAETGPNFGPISYREMKRWAGAALKDRRRRPPILKRKMRSFRFRPEILNALSSLAEKTNESETAVLERLIQSEIAKGTSQSEL